MKKLPNLFLGLLFAAAMLLAGLQGLKVRQQRDSDKLYRWVLAATTQMRIFGRLTQGMDEEQASMMKDKDLYIALSDKADALLPDLPATEQDYDKNGTAYPKLVRYSMIQTSEYAAKLAKKQAGPEKPDAEGQDMEAPALSSLPLSADEVARLTTLWDMLRSKELLSLRDDFLRYSRENRLASTGTQFGLSDMYAGQDTSISLANMFLGFRKMAANLIWLQVDRYWHSGMMHRMLPLMKTSVMLDPYFIDAFRLGAWHLSYNMTAGLKDTPESIREYDPANRARVGEKEKLYYQAIDFLKDGIRKNPTNSALYFDLGYAVYEEKMHDHSNAVTYLSEAVRHWHEKWVPRTLFRCMEYNGQYEEALTGWKGYLKDWPDNLNAPRFIERNGGLILERNAERAEVKALVAKQAAAKAREQGNEASASEWERKAVQDSEDSKRLYAEAADIWKKMADKDAMDTFSEGRMLRLKAMDLVTQARPEEAIALLDHARMASNDIFESASAMMIEIKKTFSIPLTTSERKHVERMAEKKQYEKQLPKTIEGKTFIFRDGAWSLEKYDGQPSKTIASKSDEWFQFLHDHPETKKYTAFGDPAIFSIGDVWYQLAPEAA